MTPAELKNRRKKIGLSQFALAKSARASRFNISLFENGYIELNHIEYARIKATLEKKEASYESGNSR